MKLWITIIGLFLAGYGYYSAVNWYIIIAGIVLAIAGLCIKKNY